MKKTFINLLLREDELGMISNRGNSRLWKQSKVKKTPSRKVEANKYSSNYETIRKH